MNKYDFIDPDLMSILDNWFGESLEYAENEEHLFKYLYKPLNDLIESYKDDCDGG